MSKSWWEEYPECVEAHEKAVKAYNEWANSIERVMYLTVAESEQLDKALSD